MNLTHRGLALIAVMGVAHTSSGSRPAPPLNEPLVARPGMMIGRVMTRDGRPVPRFTIEYAAYEAGSDGVRPDSEVEPNVVAKIDGHDGYYEIRLPEGSADSSWMRLPVAEAPAGCRCQFGHRTAERPCAGSSVFPSLP